MKEKRFTNELKQVFDYIQILPVGVVRILGEECHLLIQVGLYSFECMLCMIQSFTQYRIIVQVGDPRAYAGGISVCVFPDGHVYFM